MSRWRVAGLALALALLGACQARLEPTAGPGPGVPAASDRRPTVRPSAASPSSPGPSSAGPSSAGPSSAGSTAGASPGAGRAPIVLVAPPAAGATALHGTVRLDASYMVAAGAGNLIGNAGNTLVSAANGAVAVAAVGAPMVAAGAGNAIADVRPSADGTTLIGLDGGSLIGLDGGSLVGNAGNTLVGNAGNTLIGQDGGSYRLAQAGAPALPLGTQLPAAGMLVAVTSLADGKPVPVGKRPDGTPVWAVYTDAAGGYVIDPPAEARGNLRVVVAAPGTRDPRLAYGVLAGRVRAAARDVDEDADDAADYVRLCFVGLLDGLLDRDKVTTLERFIEDGFLREAGVPDHVAKEVVRRLEDAGDGIGFRGLARAERRRICTRLAAVVLASVDLDAIAVQGGAPGSALASLERGLAGEREEVRVRMNAPRAGETAQTMFAGLSALKVANERDGGIWAIKRPSDFNDFCVRAVMIEDPLDVASYMATAVPMREEMGLPRREDLTTQTLDGALPIAEAIQKRLFAAEADGRLPAVDDVERAVQALPKPAAAGSLGPAER